MISKDDVAATDFTVPFNISRVPIPDKAIKQRVSTYVVSHSEGYHEWFIGTSDDPETMLFVEHLVDREKGFYRNLTTEGAKSTRRLLKYYADKGMEADLSDLLNVHDRIYVYKKEKGTRP